jgi:hypothetical protein
MIDTLTMGFYAVICAVLAALVPVFGSTLVRIIVGAITGLAAAGIWPLIHVVYAG